MRYLDPKNDLTFKKIFGQHPHLLKSFLNGVLPFESEEEEIDTLEYLTGEQVPQIPLFKNTIVDVKCIDKKGRQFIVEMQMLWTDNFKDRVVFNASKAYVQQLDRGKKYDVLQPVYALSIVNDIFLPQEENYYHHYAITHLQNTNERLNGLEFIFVELPKFNPTTIPLKKIGVLWLRFLKEIEDQSETIPQEFLDEKYIKEALSYLQESSFSKKELITYDEYWDSISTEKTWRAGAYKDGRAKGLKEGREEGLKEGLKEGIKEGIKEGREKGELNEKIIRIKKILSQKIMNTEQIATLFDVSTEFVEKIKKEM